jgi:hypothetical protein
MIWIKGDPYNEEASSRTASGHWENGYKPKSVYCDN